MSYASTTGAVGLGGTVSASALLVAADGVRFEPPAYGDILVRSGRLAELSDRYDVLVLVGPDGWAAAVVAKLRAEENGIPILVIRTSSGRSGASELLNRGTDSCVSEDCEAHELLASLRALSRRGPWRAPSSTELLRVCADSRTLWIEGVPHAFGPVAFRIVEYLVQHRESWVSQRRIVAEAIGTHHGSASSIARVHIHHIRRGLGVHGCCIVRDEHRRCGYMFTLGSLAAVRPHRQR